MNVFTPDMVVGSGIIPGFRLGVYCKDWPRASLRIERHGTRAKHLTGTRVCHVSG
jgi:hypothetical protein